MASVAVTRAAHSAGAGATTEISPSQTEGATDEGDQRLVLVVQNSGLDLTELRLEDILDGLRLNAMPAHFELRVDSTEEVHALRLNVDFAFVPGAVEATELRVRDELLGGLLRQVAVAACNVDAADTELSDLPVEQWLEFVDLKDDVGDVGEWRANCDGLPRPQALAARVAARLCGTVGVDDLASALVQGSTSALGKASPAGTM